MLDSNYHTDRPARLTALIAQELCHYNVDIEAFSDTRLPDEGKVVTLSTGKIIVARKLEFTALALLKRGPLYL